MTRMFRTIAVVLSLAMGGVTAFTTTTTAPPPTSLFVFSRSTVRPILPTLTSLEATATATTTALASQDYEFALLFDCDGVILETEELHRLAYNAAFEEFDLTIDGARVEWSVRTFIACCTALHYGTRNTNVAKLHSSQTLQPPIQLD